jgi:hypothetical protein
MTFGKSLNTTAKKKPEKGQLGRMGLLSQKQKQQQSITQKDVQLLLVVFFLVWGSTFLFYSAYSHDFTM